MSELSKDEVAALIEDVGLDGIVEPEELLPLEALSTIRARFEELEKAKRDADTLMQSVLLEGSEARRDRTIAALQTRIEQLTRERDLLKLREPHHLETIAERDALKQRLAKVEALPEKWREDAAVNNMLARTVDPGEGAAIAEHIFETCADELRTALSPGTAREEEG